MLDKIKPYFEKYNKNANQKAKKSQMVVGLILMILMAIGLCLFIFIKDKHKLEQQVGIHDFDGVLDKKFNASTDEALIETQNKKITSISQLTKFQQENLQKASIKNEEDKVAFSSVIGELKDKIASLERDNLVAKNKLAGLIHQSAIRPPTREEQQQKMMLEQSRFYQQAPLIHMHQPKPPRKKKLKTNRNYVWAGTSVEGVLTTGILGDAGINGTKNKGSGVIRLVDNGLMPNKHQSFLKDCLVTYSSYGDLSSETAVLHLDRLSCASSLMNFEKVVFGSVYDSDAMQDLRGTAVLKSQQILSYSAAAGLLAGIGDGLKNAGNISAYNANGTISTFSSTSLAQQAVGGALSNPANKISEYIMKIADIYHPVVVVKPERKVTVIFLKGFWTEDEEEQELESRQNNNLGYRPATSTAPSMQHHNQDKATLDSLLKNQNPMNQPLFKGA